MPNIMALGQAVREIRKLGIENISERIGDLTDYLLEKAKRTKIPIAFPTEPGQRSGIVLVKATRAHMVTEVLRARNVRVSARGGGIRVSPHFYNNRDDVDRLVYHLKKLI
jgi:selenocysteine lyase/cysteine desulfurase